MEECQSQVNFMPNISSDLWGWEACAGHFIGKRGGLTNLNLNTSRQPFSISCNFIEETQHMLRQLKTNLSINK